MKIQKTVTGILLVATPLLFMGAFTLLQINFEYPDILRQPAATVLEKFAAGGSALVANWYAMLFSAILFIPIAVLLHPFLMRKDAWYLPLATVFGVLAGVVQMLGFVRWPFLVPGLARIVSRPCSQPGQPGSSQRCFLSFQPVCRGGCRRTPGLYLHRAVEPLDRAGDAGLSNFPKMVRLDRHLVWSGDSVRRVRTSRPGLGWHGQRAGVYSLGVVVAGERDLFIKTGSKPR